MIQNLKDNKLITIISVVLLLLGIYFIAVDAQSIKNLIFIILGIALILISMTQLLKKQYNHPELINHVIRIAVGLTLILFSTVVDWIFIICGIIILIEPVINIIKSNNKKGQCIVEYPKLFLGIVLILLSFNVIYKILFIAIGAILIVTAAVLLYCVIKNKNIMILSDFSKPKNSRNNDDIIDVEE